MGVVDRLLAALDRDIGHLRPPRSVTLRGSAASVVPAHRTRSTPRGYSAWLRCQTAAKSAGRPVTASTAGSRSPGPTAGSACRRPARRPAGSASRSFPAPRACRPASVVRSGSDSASGERRVARCSTIARAAMERQPVARRRRGRVEPERRLVVDQRQQHRGGGRGPAAPARPAVRPPCSVPGRAIASSTARNVACASAHRIGEAGQGDRRAHVRMFRMAKNCTRVAAALPRDRIAPRLLRRGERLDHGWPAARLPRRILQQRIGQRGEFRLALARGRRHRRARRNRIRSAPCSA